MYSYGHQARSPKSSDQVMGFSLARLLCGQLGAHRRSDRRKQSHVQPHRPATATSALAACLLPYFPSAPFLEVQGPPSRGSPSCTHQHSPAVCAAPSPVSTRRAEVMWNSLRAPDVRSSCRHRNEAREGPDSGAQPELGQRLQSAGHTGLNSNKSTTWEKVGFGASGSLETHMEKMNFEPLHSACTKLMQGGHRRKWERSDLKLL